MFGKSVFVLLLLCGVVFLSAVSASQRISSPAQNPSGSTSAVPILTQTSDDDPNYINEAIYEKNNEINQLIALADNLAREGEWRPAIMYYQQALVAVFDQKSNGLAIVRSVNTPGLIYNQPYGALIRARLLKMDSTEVAFYRAEFERSASSAFDAACKTRDSSVIEKVAQLWPFTKSGQKATAAVASIAAEKGDFITAARQYLDLAETIKAWPPYAPQEYATALAGAAYCYATSGSRNGLDEVEALAKADTAALGAKVKLDGIPMTLGAHIASLSKDVVRPASEALHDWSAMGGDAARSRAFPGNVGKIGAKMWHHQINYKSQAFYVREGKAFNFFTNPLVAPVPIYSEGCLYSSTGYGLVALDGFIGRNVFKKQPGNVDIKRDPFRSKQDKIDAATLHDGILYTIASSGIRQYGLLTLSLRKMLAIDASTGKEIWNLVKDTGLDDNYLACGAPVPYRDSVVFQARRVESLHIQYYLVCADAKTGALRWRTALAHTPLSGIRYYGHREAANIIATSGNIAIVQSAASTITSVNLDTGRIAWGIRYNSDFTNHRTGGQYHRMYDAPANVANPPMIVGDRVIVKPCDSFRVMCLRIDDGQLLWSKTDSRIAHLAGIDGNKLFVVGPGVREIDIITGKTIFENEYKYKVTDKKNPSPYHLNSVCGRPALASDALYISTSQSLYRFDRATKKLEKSFDWKEHDLLPGNLLITDDGFFVSNSEEVAAFSMPAIAQSMTEKLKQKPDDPLLLLRRASGLLASGRADVALKDLDVAFKKTDPQRRYAGHPMREAITFVKSKCYSSLADSQTDPRKAVEMAKLAVQHAVVRDRKVQTICALADKQLALGLAGLPQAVASFQGIIRNYPEEMMRFGKHFEQSAANYAANRIAAILREHGRAAYALAESEAQTHFAAALQASARDKMLDVYKLYPNSITNFKTIAWLTNPKNGGVGSGFEAAALRVALARCADKPQIAPWLMRLQQLAQDAGDRELETETLQRLASLPPETQLPGDLAPVAVVAYAKKRLARIAYLVANDGTQAPLPKDASLLFEDKYYTKNSSQQARLQFLSPQGLRPEIMHDKILLRRGSVFECVSLKTGKRLWASHPSRQWLGLSISIDPKTKRMIIKTVFHGANAAKAGLRVNDIIVAINGMKMSSVAMFRRALDAIKDGDKVRMETLRGKVRKISEIIAEPIPASFTPHLSNFWYMGRDRLVVVSSYPSLNLRCINLNDGKILWESKGLAKRPNTRSPLPDPLQANAGSFRANGLFSYFNSSGSIGAIVTLDLKDGREVARLKIDKEGFMRFAIAGGLYLIQHGDKCLARDILSGTLRYRFTLFPESPNLYRKVPQQPITVTADRLVVFPNHRHILAAVDLLNAREMSIAPSLSRPSPKIRRSEQYIMVFSMPSPTEGFSSSCHLVDGMRFEAVPNINLKAKLSGMAFYEKTILFSKAKGADRSCALYNIETRNLIYTKIQSKEQYNYEQISKPAGRYIVIAGHLTRPIPATPPNPNAPKKTETVFLASVIDAATGKEICGYIRRLDRRAYMDVCVVDGKFCIVYRNTMMVLGKASSAK